MPRVSICLPNLRNRPFLGERLDSIIAQTFTDWELVVVDSYSDDGAWEYLCARAENEPRMRLMQAPRGLYQSWNRCIEMAQGRFIHIATSDDTMSENFLERMVDALERNPDCGLAHSPLRTFDAEGRVLPDHWSSASMFGCSSGALVRRRHRRLAPHDGLLHLAGRSVYTSITQLLIRRTVFDKIGGFSTCWGSMGDMHWNMRATLRHNTIHVPDTWGGWRLHVNQATNLASSRTPQHQTKIRDLIEDVLLEADDVLTPRVKQMLRERWRPWFDSKLRFERDILGEFGFVARIDFLVRSLFGPDRGAAGDFLLGRLLGNRAKIDCRRLKRVLGTDTNSLECLIESDAFAYCQRA